MAIKLANETRVYLVQYELSLGGREYAIAAVLDTVSSEDLEDLVRKGTAALGATEASVSGLWDTAATALEPALEALNGTDTDQVLTVQLGTAVGDHAIITLVRVVLREADTRLADMAAVNGGFVGQQFPEYAIVLAPRIVAAATGNLASVDNAASSTAGGAWSHHVIAWSASGGNAQWKLHLEDSADDASWADKDVVTVTAVSGARRALTGTIRRYTRAKAELDASSGSITYTMALSRA